MSVVLAPSCSIPRREMESSNSVQTHLPRLLLELIIPAARNLEDHTKGVVSEDF